MAEARAAVHTLRVGSLSLEQVTSAAKLRGVQMVLNSAPDSWLRNNRVANFLWSIDENLIGFLSLSEYFPRGLRYTALCTLLFLSLINRLTMRLLLQYRGWMYERKPSMATTIWGAVMKTFFLGQGKNALTYSFQNAMPRLPVPPLKETITKYLRSVEPLLSETEIAEVQKEAQAFICTEGPTLQRFLIAKSWLSGNYVSDWWEKYIYLRGRSPILINSNYYGLGYAYHIPSAVQTARAGVLVHFFARFKELMDSERLQPMTIRGTVPVCMRQFERLFATTRVPGRDTDTLRHIPGQTTTHVAVLYKGTYWRVDTLSDTGRLLEPYQLQDQFDTIVHAVDDADVSGLRVPPRDDPEANLPALTAWNRTQWAEVREDYFSYGLNRMSLEEIESSIFFVHLDDRAPETWSDMARLSLHGGDGACRWCDKSFNLLVFANGQGTVHAEHSWADAPVVAYAWEWVLSHEHITSVYDKAGHCIRPTPVTPALAAAPSSSPPSATPGAGAPSAAAASSGKAVSKAGQKQLVVADKVRGPVRLEWMLKASARELIRQAMVHAKALCDDLDLVVDCYDVKHGGYGKGLIKDFKCGPDAWIQMALQLAYYRDQGHLDLTYESAATRLFNEGRTETIRSVSKESKEFIQLFTDSKATNKQKIQEITRAARMFAAEAFIQLCTDSKATNKQKIQARIAYNQPSNMLQALRKAADQHQETSRDASCGKGVDRHLFALYVVSMGLGKDIKFLKESLSIPWRLSTSQIPQRQTEGIITKLEDHMVSPSGGFGPVADDGYGVSYMMASDSQTFFHVSSKFSCKATDSNRFKEAIFQALSDMREVLVSGAAN